MKSIIVYLGTRLSRQEFFDDNIRGATLADGVRDIRNHAQGVTILATNPVSCTVSVVGPRPAIKVLQHFLDASGLGYQEDSPSRPLLRAAENV